MCMCRVPRQLLAAVMGGVLLGGCSGLDFVINPVGVGSPAPSKVAGYLQDTTSQAVYGPNGQPMTAGEYLIASMSFTNEKCHEFFDTLERFKEDSSLIDKVLTAAAAAGSPLLAATSASGTAVAKFTGILNFSNLINNNYREIYTFADYKEPLQTHVFDTMGSFRLNNGLTTLTRSLVGTNEFDAPSKVAVTKGNAVEYAPVIALLSRSGQSCGPYSGNYSVSIPISKPDGKTENANTSVNYCKLNDFLHSSDPIHVMVARNIASEYASICSIASMKTIIYQALHKTRTGTDPKMPDSPTPVTAAITPPN